MSYINFTEGVHAVEVAGAGIPATLYFYPCSTAVSAMTAASVFADLAITSGTTVKSQAKPTPSARVWTFTAITWTGETGSPKSVVMKNANAGGTDKIICAWDINGGVAVDFAVSSPVAVTLAFKLAYYGEA